MFGRWYLKAVKDDITCPQTGTKLTTEPSFVTMSVFWYKAIREGQAEVIPVTKDVIEREKTKRGLRSRAEKPVLKSVRRRNNGH